MNSRVKRLVTDILHCQLVCANVLVGGIVLKKLTICVRPPKIQNSQ